MLAVAGRLHAIDSKVGYVSGSSKYFMVMIFIFKVMCVCLFSY